MKNRFNMKDPAFLFYSSDFLSGVQDLTMEERGQYITLLCLQHQKGHLSDKIIKLAVANAAADVMAKFRQDSAGLWYNTRLELEAEKRAAHSEKQRKRALDGWEKRKKEAVETTAADAVALPLENENEIENEIEDKSDYVEFTKIWFEFFKQRGLPKPSFNSAQGKSLKEIITKSKELAKGNFTPMDTFKYILDNWDRQDEWMRVNALDLKVFNGKFNVIVSRLKTDTKKPKQVTANF